MIGSNSRSGGKEQEEELAALQSQCQTLREEAQQAKTQHQHFKSQVDQQLFQTKLELKTTQRLYNDVTQEKDK